MARQAGACGLRGVAMAAGAVVFFGASQVHAGGVPCSYDVAVIQGPGCPPFDTPPVTIVTGLNNHGHVCGYYWHCDFSGANQPFVWTPEGGMQEIPIPPGVFSVMPADINDHGVIVGTMSVSGVGFRGFVYEDGVWTILEPPFPQGLSSATAINNARFVCGSRSIGPAQSPYNAYIWSAQDGFVDLGVIDEISDARDITEAASVVGSTGGVGVPGQVGYSWHGGRVTMLQEPEGSVFYLAVAAAETGLVLGGARFELGQGFGRGVVWHGDSYTLLEPYPGFPSCSAADFNATGLIVGRSTDSSQPGTETGVIWIGYDGAVERLIDLLENPPPQLASIRTSRGINDADQIIADASISGYPAGVLLTPVEFPVGDINCDSFVNGIDLGTLLANWSIPVSAPGCDGASICAADLTGDGFVNGIDLAILLSNWSLQ